MKKNYHFPMTLIAIAIVSGCATTPPNPALTEAHSRFNSARSNADITSLAPLELQDASNSLTKADLAFSKNEHDVSVNQLSYIASQQVGIAEETAKRKMAEVVVNNASANRNEVRLEARTAEVDAANANAVKDRALIAKQEAELAALNAKKTERGMVITLGDVLFNTGKSQLKSGGVRNVQKLADYLSQYPEYKVLVEGHTDSVGSDENNQELSEQRAASVQSALFSDGISSDRVATRGYGEGFPVASNDNAASRQLNRRVEIVLSDSSGNIAPR